MQDEIRNKHQERTKGTVGRTVLYDGERNVAAKCKRDKCQK